MFVFVPLILLYELSALVSPVEFLNLHFLWIAMATALSDLMWERMDVVDIGNPIRGHLSRQCLPEKKTKVNISTASRATYKLDQISPNLGIKKVRLNGIHNVIFCVERTPLSLTNRFLVRAPISLHPHFKRKHYRIDHDRLLEHTTSGIGYTKMMEARPNRSSQQSPNPHLVVFSRLYLSLLLESVILFSANYKCFPETMTKLALDQYRSTYFTSELPVLPGLLTILTTVDTQISFHCTTKKLKPCTSYLKFQVDILGI